ncbi:ADP-ribosylation factor [Klebsormidium nitens]|uniref:ADP-ribosylation factor n=1 Tax=Klebsormidium nitens TaxID=105231 RepID=A0A1Y1HKJ5_KLENI|nr:ADP-ribosylation factor [Klebsormidium nitens]|eukprot:GAQ77659.1 ADP-ribosylation factor [Klebsormidium nitens]
MTLAIVGLDNAGKSTLLANVRGESPEATVPTWGFINKEWKMGSWNIVFYDLGGARKIRKIWERYYAEIHGLVFVVDASDEARLEEVREELERAVRHPYMAQKAVLIFANKQDKKMALGPAEVAAGLGLSSTGSETYKVVGCSGIYAEGETPDSSILDGMLWLIGSIDKHFVELDARVRDEAEEQMALEKRLKAERKVRADSNRAERQRNEAHVHPDPESDISTAPAADTSTSSAAGLEREAQDDKSGAASGVAPSSIPVLLDSVEALPVSSLSAAAAEASSADHGAGFDLHPFALESAPPQLDRPGSRGSDGKGRKKYVLTEDVELKQGSNPEEAGAVSGHASGVGTIQ